MSKVSAFNVYRNKCKLKKDGEESEQSGDLEIKSPTSSDQDSSKGKAGSLTPPSAEKIKKGARSEPRFNTFRKSLLKRSKKDDVDSEAGAKENKIQKTNRRPESVSLEEHFLPEVVKQRKEQEELHGVANNKEEGKDFDSPDKKCQKIKKLNSNSSLDGHKESRKQLLHKRQVQSEKRMKRAQSLNERMIEQEGEDAKGTTGEQLFEWVIAPVTTQRFFACRTGQGEGKKGRDRGLNRRGVRRIFGSFLSLFLPPKPTVPLATIVVRLFSIYDDSSRYLLTKGSCMSYL